MRALRGTRKAKKPGFLSLIVFTNQFPTFWDGLGVGVWRGFPGLGAPKVIRKVNFCWKHQLFTKYRREGFHTFT